jgi:beta-phosphoglucomutase-like phosphatase (HAD superfamily)
VLASSGTAELVKTFMDLVDAHDLADAWTSSEDAESSKPAPDIVQSALAKIGRDSGAGRPTGQVRNAAPSGDLRLGRRSPWRHLIA